MYHGQRHHQSLLEKKGELVGAVCGFEWSDKLEGLQDLGDHIPFHPRLIFFFDPCCITITLCPVQQRNTGQECLRQETQWGQDPIYIFQTPLGNASVCSVYDAQPQFRRVGRGSSH